MSGRMRPALCLIRTQGNRREKQEETTVEIPTRLFNAALMVAPQAVDEILAAKTAGTLPEKASGTESSSVVDEINSRKIRRTYFGK